METLSIISGKFKNQKIQLVEDNRTKYTPSKVKNAIFSILESKQPVKNTIFLDLCAGSGQMGLEALSRGASFVTFVDISDKSIKALKKNVQRLNVSDYVRIYKKDVLRFLKKPPETYDLIFIDPPFNEVLFHRIAKQLFNTTGIVKPGGRIILESFKGYKNEKIEHYSVEDNYSYSSVRIEILKRKG
ncbi:MAG: 16S rRNA (guanine(966)-N(2))-methyltransferase RsmD [Thermotogota bacterium]|nr:16S rRNA (guanine(966)-N(2))-methyltransferase RsmD [Thermotogota bacterium]